jgi:hypothetical protein
LTFVTVFGWRAAALAVTGAVSWAVTVVPPAVPEATATLVKFVVTFARVHV